MKHIKAFYFLSLVVTLFCLGLMSGTNGSAADQNPCSEDIAKFCKQVGTDKQAVLDCLEQHEHELSGSCRDYEAKIMEGTRAEKRERVREAILMRQACQEEIANFCKDVNSGQGRIIECLSENESKLSVPCRDKVKAAKEAKE